MVTLVATLVAEQKAPWQPSLAMRCLDHLDNDDNDHDRADNVADDEIEDEGEDGDDDACLSGCGWGEGEIHSLQTETQRARLGENIFPGFSTSPLTSSCFSSKSSSRSS